MPKRSPSIDLAHVMLDKANAQPLHRQLYAALRREVLQGTLLPGTRIPSTRDLARSLGISRNTVVAAFEQLIAEGYLESHIGDGCYVSRAVAESLPQVQQAAALRPAQTRALMPGLSTRGLAIMHMPANNTRDEGKASPFRIGGPGIDEFPGQLWARLTAHHWRKSSQLLLGYGNNLGYAPLRQAISAYLGASRGVQCSPEQVIITSGAQGALQLIALLLLNPGDTVWAENPGYRGARAALLAAGAQLLPVPVDSQGLDFEAAMHHCPTARMVYVTPSHQYPMGVTMSLARRLALIDWARRAGAWIIEDDYDSEFRYQGRPLASLQGLDGGQCVVYIGTFSKILFPALRLGYMVIPEVLIDQFQAVLGSLNHHLPGIEQAVLTDFLTEGHLLRHIRHMRQLYAERQHMLIEMIQTTLGSDLQICAAEAGLHVTGLLAAHIDDRAVSAEALRLGIEAPALSSYSLCPLSQGGLVLGYAGLSTAQIRAGVFALGEAIRRSRL